MIVVAIVRKYLPNNVNVDYDDGSFEWFDTTQLSIVEPLEVSGRIIQVDHNVPQRPESPWRKIEARLRLDLDEDIFNEKPGQSIQIFSDGVQILAIEEDANHL